ncbi:MAG: carbon-monoxide dehydrogenase small subunit [Paracrocinitomix sp.]|jgi:carbon-monoxide dehydrogenase small subunit
MSLPSATTPIGETLAINVTINGVVRSLNVEPRRSFADVIREDVGLTGTHLGCEHGVCGACTILLDGEPSRACLMLAVQADGADVVTIEGLADDDGTLHPVQQGMYQAMSFQCAFCSPGFLMSAVALLRDNPNPSEAEIREELSGNLCRCTGYQSIVDGVETAVSLIASNGAQIRAAAENA